MNASILLLNYSVYLCWTRYDLLTTVIDTFEWEQTHFVDRIELTQVAIDYIGRQASLIKLNDIIYMILITCYPT